MGSPQNYYGVGFYEGLVSHTSVATGHTSCDAPSWDAACAGNLATAAPSGGQWTPTSGTIQASVNSNNNVYATENTNGEKQQLSTFGLLSGRSAIPTPGTGQALTINGHRGAPLRRVRVRDLQQLDDRRPAVVGRRDDVVHGRRRPANLGTNTSTGDYMLGSSSTTSDWGAHAWGRNDFSDANFRVRLTANKGCGTSSTTLNLDQLELRVGWSMTTTTTTKEVLPVPDPATGSALDPQGFWGAMFTSGGYRENGDKYGPRYLGNGTRPACRPEQPDLRGGRVRLHDRAAGRQRRRPPVRPDVLRHRATTGTAARSAPATTGPAAPPRPASRRWPSPTRCTTRRRPCSTPTDDTQVATLTYDPGSATMGDLSGAFGTPTNSTAANRQDCSSNPAHNHWVDMKNGLPSATYRLNVNTSSAAGNVNVGAENLFSIWAKSLGNARVFGGGRMAAYTNLDGGLQKFYFAQIETGPRRQDAWRSTCSTRARRAATRTSGS